MIHGALRDGRRRAANAPSTRFAFICSRPTAWPCRAFATSSSLAQGPAPIPSANLPNASRPKAGKQRLAPKREQPLTAQQRLELCLPPHLRDNADGTVQDETSFEPDALETAKLALEAFTGGKGFLTYLAIDQGRWRAAVWLAKLLIEQFHSPPARSSRSSQLIQEWTTTETLDDITEQPVYLNPFANEHVNPHIKTSTSPTLDELTDGSPDTFSGLEVLRHKILGLIWRDIGRLIIVCSSDTTIAGGQVKPDVLEMIALLHHYELMPNSIYTYNPPESEDAIYQPPTLPLLSHRIFEALSDATWRAREMSALEEAKKKIGGPVTLEARGSSIRARIPGVKPEVWLELILWSCLHGGWISDGASLLNSLFRSRAQEKWTTISWRDSLNAVVPSGYDEPSNWDGIRSMFDARSSSSTHGVDVTGLRVHKTVSSEVVNAYIDALVTTVKLGVGERGTDLDIVLRQLRSLRKLLQRANLNLGGGSWDAMMLRLVESGAIDLDEDPAIVQHLATLSPTIGEELQSRRSQAVPSYVLDGSAAMLGLLHRALHTEIKNSNLDGALKIFQILQERVDKDMHQSMSDFFANKHLSVEENQDSSKGMFTSNFTGIEYPSFKTQIPPVILATFLDLVTENKAYSLGNWMLGLDNRDIDGPPIPLSLYRDPHISAAIVHFAAATENTALLSKITEEGTVRSEGGDTHEPTLPKELLQAFLDAQVDARHWDSAVRLLEYMRDTEGFDWNVNNAATVAKVLIIESQDSSAWRPGSHFRRAETLFTSMLAGEYGTSQLTSHQEPRLRASYQTLYKESLCALVSFVSPELAATMLKLEALPKKFDFRLRPRAFNIILQAVVTTQNSEAGRVLVDRFSRYYEQPHEFRQSRRRPEAEEDIVEDVEHVERDALSEFDAPATFRPRMPRTLDDAAEAHPLSRSTIALEIAGEKSNYKRNTIMYGGFTHRGPSVVLTVVRKALAERAEQKARRVASSSTEPDEEQMQRQGEPLTPSLDIFVWALITLRRAGIDRSTVIAELNNTENGLTDEEMERVEQLAMDQWQAITDEWMARERHGPLPINRGYFVGRKKRRAGTVRE